MKKFLFVLSLALLIPDALSQNVNEELDRVIRMLSELVSETSSQKVTGETDLHVENKKKKGYFNTTQIGMLMGNRQITERFSVVTGGWGVSLIEETRTKMQISPSLTMTNGYMFNEHWAAGIGVGYEIFEWNFFPVFADIRYTLWESKISPFFTVKAGYSFGDFKKKHYDNLLLHYAPYNVGDVDFRNYGGMMLHPEMGVKVAISENADLLFSIAYRYQKIKTTITRDYVDQHGGRSGQQWDAWDHKTILNRLSLGIAIMFR